MPVEQKSGEIRYITGGVGSDEVKAMRAVRGRYSLALTFAMQVGNTGYYTSSAQLRIARAGGGTVLEASADGPFLFVELPPGTYDLSAELAGEKLERRGVVIQPGAHTELVLRWVRSSLPGH